MTCPCGSPLARSLYSVAGPQLVKSCAYCSRLAGEHVYHPLAAFGLWHRYKDASTTPQSECIAAYRARTSGTPVPAAVVTCSGMRAAGAYPTNAQHPAIREALEPLRAEAEEALAANEKVGRRVCQDGEKLTAPRGRVYLVPSESAREIAVHAEAAKAMAPTVFRRRAGQVAPATRRAA
jgi:hypothetical protein